ncbi:hypothetical protein BOX15_Mlig009207g2, partial [Macrostomum lignano]
EKPPAMSSEDSPAPVSSVGPEVDALSMKAALSSAPTTGHYMAGMTAVAWLCRNAYLKAPWFYQLPQGLVGTAAVFTAGYLLDVYWNNELKMRAAYVADFKRTHPELYPETRRLRWGEVLDPWVPKR